MCDERIHAFYAADDMNCPTARLENREQLDTEVRKADVICIVYAVNKPETFARVGDFWLPYIRKLGRNVRPVESCTRQTNVGL